MILTWSVLHESARVLIFEEGFTSNPQEESIGTGLHVIGFGKSITEKEIANFPEVFHDWTVERASDDLLHSVGHIVANIDRRLWVHTDPIRMAILVSMIYQMGPTGFDEYKRFQDAVSQRKWHRAMAEMYYGETHNSVSKWYAQTPGRVQRHAYQIATGNVHPDYYHNDQSDNARRAITALAMAHVRRK